MNRVAELEEPDVQLMKKYATGPLFSVQRLKIDSQLHILEIASRFLGKMGGLCLSFFFFFLLYIFVLLIFLCCFAVLADVSAMLLDNKEKKRRQAAEQSVEKRKRGLLGEPLLAFSGTAHPSKFLLAVSADYPPRLGFLTPLEEIGAPSRRPHPWPFLQPFQPDVLLAVQSFGTTNNPMSAQELVRLPRETKGKAQCGRRGRAPTKVKTLLEISAPTRRGAQALRRPQLLRAESSLRPNGSTTRIPR